MNGIFTDSPAPAPDGKPACLGWVAVSRLVCRYILAAVFLMAALSKILDLAAFSDRLVLHSGLPYKTAIVVAMILPWLELVCGLCLALGFAVREAATLLSALLVLFLAHSLLRYGEGDCGCFLFPSPTAFDVPGWWPPLRDLLLFLCGIRLVLGERHDSSLYGPCNVSNG
jgi:putative oxidoreductase